VFGGAEKSLLILIKHLNRKRFTPFVMCPPKSEFGQKLDEAGVKCYPMIYPRLKNIFAAIYAVIKIRSIIRREAINLIHANSPRANLIGAAAARVCRIPVIWHARNLLDEGMIDIDRIFSPLADKIICNSEAIRKRFTAIPKFNEKTSAILNGIDLNEFHPGINGRDILRQLNIDTSAPVIGIISRLWPDKGHRYFIEAAAQVVKEFPGSRFVIVGDYQAPEYSAHKKELDRLIRSLDLEGNINFLGYRTDINRVMAGMDIVILPSESEGCSRVLLEAMAMGKPVVASASGGTPELVADGQTGILVPIKDSAILAKALIKLLSDADLLRRMGQKGRHRAETLFSITRNLEETMAVYEELIT
jgi:glycosyltransferase involved in cell wall biosynthesis